LSEVKISSKRQEKSRAEFMMASNWPEAQPAYSREIVLNLPSLMTRVALLTQSSSKTNVE
jgi:hypothetical protein